MRLRKNNSEIKSSERRRPEQATNKAVFSYYARGASQSSQNTGRRDESSPSASQLRTGFRWGYVPSYIALLAILVAGVYSIGLETNPRIVVENIPGTIHRDSKVYQDGIQDIWRQSIWNRTKLTVQDTALEQKILNEYSEIGAIQIELPLLGRRPTIFLTPGSPILQLVSPDGTFYVDANGKVMAPLVDVTATELANIPYIRDESGSAAEVGKPVVAGSQALFLAQLARQLQADAVQVQSISLPSGGANQADVRIAGQNYFIKFAIDDDPRQAVGTYLAIRDKLGRDGVVPAEYIDVRVPEKAFYK